MAIYFFHGTKIWQLRVMSKNLLKKIELYITQRKVLPIWSITLSPLGKGKMSVPYILQNNDNQARIFFKSYNK